MADWGTPGPLPALRWSFNDELVAMPHLALKNLYEKLEQKAEENGGRR